MIFMATLKVHWENSLFVSSPSNAHAPNMHLHVNSWRFTWKFNKMQINIMQVITAAHLCLRDPMSCKLHDSKVSLPDGPLDLVESNPDDGRPCRTRARCTRSHGSRLSRTRRFYDGSREGLRARAKRRTSRKPSSLFSSNFQSGSRRLPYHLDKRRDSLSAHQLSFLFLRLRLCIWRHECQNRVIVGVAKWQLFWLRWRKFRSICILMRNTDVLALFSMKSSFYGHRNSKCQNVVFLLKVNFFSQ